MSPMHVFRQWNGTAQPDGQCSGWRGLWFDYNVEMNYYMAPKAHRPELVGSLAKPMSSPGGLAALHANGLTMAFSHVNETWAGAFGVSCGMGLNLSHYLSEGANKTSGKGWAGCHPSAVDPDGKPFQPGECLSLDFLHAAHVVWRECAYAEDPAPCLGAVVPLLQGGIKAMALHSTTDARGRIHLKPTYLLNCANLFFFLGDLFSSIPRRAPTSHTA